MNQYRQDIVLKVF
jgi:calcyphosin